LVPWFVFRIENPLLVWGKECLNILCRKGTNNEIKLAFYIVDTYAENSTRLEKCKNQKGDRIITYLWPPKLLLVKVL
jgi:hypothetical protein